MDAESTPRTPVEVPATEETPEVRAWLDREPKDAIFSDAWMEWLDSL